MKKSLVLAAFALFAAVACNKNAENQQVPENESETPVPVRITSNLKGVHVTKAVASGAGALDAWTGSEDIHVFALKRLAQGVLDYETPFIKDVTAKSPVSGTAGSINLLNPATSHPAENPEYTEPFYYGDKKDDVYDFFGYYVDNAVSEPVAVLGDNGYYVHAVIDGTQDLMVARADTAGLAVSGDRTFSGYAARRLVQPNLLFKHKLSRFQFTLHSGSPVANEKVSISSISVKSNSEADMIVAAPGADTLALVNPANAKYLVMDFSQNPLHWENSTDDLDAGSLLVIPGEEVYELQLQLIQDGSTTDQGTVRDLEIDFNKIIGGTGNKFAEPGYQYNVTVVIYGLEDVEVTVTMEEWKDGGETLIDPDED